MSIKARNAHFTNWAKVVGALADKGVTDESTARAFLANSENNPFYYMVCFIKDSKELYTHGQFYNCEERSSYKNLLSENDPNKILVSTEDSFVLKDVAEIIGVENTSLQLKFYCVEPVQLVVNSFSTTYEANSVINVYFKDGDVFEVIPTSSSSIMTLDAWPGTLNYFYPWLEGVQVFNNIIFDMNAEDMYTK